MNPITFGMSATSKPLPAEYKTSIEHVLNKQDPWGRNLRTNTHLPQPLLRFRYDVLPINEDQVTFTVRDTGYSGRATSSAEKAEVSRLTRTIQALIEAKKRKPKYAPYPGN